MDSVLERAGAIVGDPRDRVHIVRQIFAFAMVGGSGAAAFVLLSTLLVGAHLGLPNWLGSTLCWAALIGPVYLAHRRFSFRSAAPHGQALPRYVGVQVCALLLAALFSYVAYSVFAFPVVWASLIVTGAVSGVNFLILRLWAFAHHAELPVTQKLPIGDESAATN
ncbi:MAG TPA: GtrA family protein [Devosiaceae bacterium]|nr:GtrA family protein [Devosiaceae bacterium]